MAGGAGRGRKTRLSVRRIISCVIRRDVTRSAIRGQALIYAARVAGRAGNPDMFSRQGERCLGVVIEFPVRPGDRIVASRANHRSEARLCMRRVARSVVLVDVATAAGGRRIRKISAHVALRALQVGVRIGQREKLCVIEIRVAPARGRVAGSASRRREPRLHVRRIISGVVLCRVAGSAISRRAGELPVDMALIARDGVMLGDQRECRLGVVVKVGVEPTRCVVAGRTHVRREPRLRMRRVVRAVVILRVAAVAIGGRAREFPADVAGSAFERRMRTRQREAGELQMVEFRPEPGIGTVAGFAGRREGQ